MNTEQFFAVCPRGLEPLLADELRSLGARDVATESGGAAFAGALRTAYAANLHSRIASRVLWQVATADVGGEAALYDAARGIAWEDHFDARQTLRVDLNASRSPLRSLDFATLRIKDAIVDRLRDATGERPSIDRSRPDVRVFAYLAGERLTLYLDLSGEPLFKRGWRAEKGEAPLKENLAAALLMLAGWSADVPLLDPFCGSGTIAIEAALIASRRAPGLNRRFGFESLSKMKTEADKYLSVALEIIGKYPESGLIDATEESFWFGFKDDVMLRVSSEGEGCRIDIRSTSRVGLSGRSAQRDGGRLQQQAVSNLAYAGQEGHAIEVVNNH